MIIEILNFCLNHIIAILLILLIVPNLPKIIKMTNIYRKEIYKKLMGEEI